MLGAMRNRRTLLAALVPALLLALGALLVWPRRSAIAPANAERIQEGMPLAAVEELLGGPARNESGMPDNFVNDAFVLADADAVKAGRLRPGARPFDERRWASPGYVVVVECDDSGRVLRHAQFTFRVDSPFLDRLRRWLGR
jgi:hypothetical protein